MAYSLGALGLALHLGCYLLGPPIQAPLSYAPQVSFLCCAWANWALKALRNVCQLSRTPESQRLERRWLMLEMRREISLGFSPKGNF